MLLNIGIPAHLMIEHVNRIVMSVTDSVLRAGAVD